MYIQRSKHPPEDFPIKDFHRVLEAFGVHANVSHAELLNAIDADKNCHIELSEAHAFSTYFFAALHPQHPTEPDIDVDLMLKIQLQETDMSKFNDIKEMVNKYSLTSKASHMDDDRKFLDNFLNSFKPSLHEALREDRSKLKQKVIDGLCL